MIDIIAYFIATSALVTFISSVLLLAFYTLLPEIKNKEKVTSPKVSVLVPFYNENCEILTKTLSMLEAQQYPYKLQVVLIDDGSTNNTLLAVKGWVSQSRKQDYIILQREKNGGRKGLALDYALNSGKLNGEVYIVVDSDTFINFNGIYELVKKLWSNDRYAAVCGFIMPEYNDKSSLISKLQYYEHISLLGATRAAQDRMGKVGVLAGAFVAHRASVVKEIGGWSEWLVEDIAWSWKALAANYHTGFAINAIATTQCPTTAGALFRQRRRWARGHLEAYKAILAVSKFNGVSFMPRLIFLMFRFLFPPLFILIPFVIYFGLWLVLAMLSINFILYCVLSSFAIKKQLHLNIKSAEIMKIPFYLAVLDVLTWIPNILGYSDEIFGKKQSWLTR